MPSQNPHASPFGYDGVRVVVTGAASGIGAATARRLRDLGAVVTGIDVREPSVDGVRFVPIDLTNPESIDSGSAELGRVQRLFNCAGLSGYHPAEQVMKANFLGLRQLTEAVAEQMSDRDAIVSIASLGGIGFGANLVAVKELLATPSLAAGWKWCTSRPEQFEKGAYAFSKQCLIAYTLSECVRLAARGIRINVIGPGPVDTPMLQDSAKSVGADTLAAIPRPLGRNSTPEEQAEVLVWLNSALASYVNGQLIWTDGGYASAMAVGVLEGFGM